MVAWVEILFPIFELRDPSTKAWFVDGGTNQAWCTTLGSGGTVAPGAIPHQIGTDVLGTVDSPAPPPPATPFLGCGHPSPNHVVVTNNGLTVQGGGVAGPELAQTCTLASGQFYFEVTVNSGVPADHCGFGIALSTATETDIVIPPAPLPSVGGWNGGIGYVSNGNVIINGANLPNSVGNGMGAYGTGTIIGVAIDTVGQLIWFNQSNGFVFDTNNPNSYPSLNRGPIPVGILSFSPLGSPSQQYALTFAFPAGTTDQFTINNGNSSFHFVPPMGFAYGWNGIIPNQSSYSTWDTTASVNVNFGPNNYGAVAKGSTPDGVRSSKSYSGGKRYLEFTISQLDWNGGWAGIIDGSASISGAATAGHAVVIVNIGNPNGQVHINAIGQVAVDMDNRLVWLRGRNTDHWNNNVSADPATGVGGVSIAALTPPYFFACGSAAPLGFGSIQMYVLISNPSYFSYSVPSGFTAGF